MIYWANSDDDIRTKIKLVLGIERAKSLETLQGFAHVVNAALGGKQKPKPLENEAQARAAFGSIFGPQSVSQIEGGVDPFAGLDETFAKMEDK